jgi:hypothetical protein
VPIFTLENSFNKSAKEDASEVRACSLILYHSVFLQVPEVRQKRCARYFLKLILMLRIARFIKCSGHQSDAYISKVALNAAIGVIINLHIQIVHFLNRDLSRQHHVPFLLYHESCFIRQHI